MRKIKNYVLLMGLISLSILLLDVNAFPLVNNNGSGRSYEEPGTLASGSDNSIEGLITLAAGNYLSANVNIETILKMIELQNIQGIDSNALNYELDNGLNYLKNSLQAYDVLIKKAEITPYNVSVIAKLKDFKYDSYMLTNGLDKDIFAEVKSFLITGNVTGIFKKTYADLAQILKLMQTVKNELLLNRIADISIFWKLNETCSRSDLFGSYVSRIFSVIL